MAMKDSETWGKLWNGDPKSEKLGKNSEATEQLLQVLKII
jgi:hypothetical protein